MGKNKKKKGYRAEELAKKTIRVESISQGRFAIIDAETGEILDDANGYGYKSKQNAMRAWNYKTQPKDENVEKFKQTIYDWWKHHHGLSDLIDAIMFDTVCKDGDDFTEKDAIEIARRYIEENNIEKPQGIHTWQLVHYYYKFR